MILKRLFSPQAGFARSLAAVGTVVAVVLWGCPVLAKTAPPGWPDAYGYYDWAEASRVIAVGKVTAVDNNALQVDVSEVLRGVIQSKRIAVSPSLVSGCTGPFRVLQAGEQAVFFIKGVERGHFALVYPGTVLKMRFAGPDTVPSIRRLLEIAALPQKERRERAVIDLLDSRNKVLHEAARQFISAHVLISPDPDRFAPQLIGKLSSPDPEVREVAARGLSRARSAAAMKALVRATRDPSVSVVCAASEGLGRFNTPESITALLALFRHPHSEARLRACLDISRHVTPEVVKALVKATRDPVAGVRARAATALLYSIREKKADVAIPRLREMLHDRDVRVRGRAAEALAETRDPGLVHTFLAILGDRPLSNEEETPVLRALNMLPWNDPTVKAALSRRVPRLAECLRLGRAPWAVAGLLESAHTPDARRILGESAKNHPRDDVREHAALALKRWDAGT
jgi:HEAT repeat protein